MNVRDRIASLNAKVLGSPRARLSSPKASTESAPMRITKKSPILGGSAKRFSNLTSASQTQNAYQPPAAPSTSFNIRNNSICNDSSNVNSIVVIQSGQLDKRGQVNTSWKRRYFVLTNVYLSYYINKEMDPQGMIESKSILSVSRSTKPSDSEFCFSVMTNSSRGKVELRATTERDMYRWLTALRHIAKKNKSKQKEDTVVRKSEEQFFSVPKQAELHSFVPEGFMLKRGLHNHAWKRRYWRLDADKLSYFKDNKHLNAIGHIDLKLISDVRKSHAASCAIEIITSSRVWVLCPDSFRDQVYWINIIRKYCKLDVAIEGSGAAPALAKSFVVEEAPPPDFHTLCKNVIEASNELDRDIVNAGTEWNASRIHELHNSMASIQMLNMHFNRLIEKWQPQMEEIHLHEFEAHPVFQAEMSSQLKDDNLLKVVVQSLLGKDRSFEKHFQHMKNYIGEALDKQVQHLLLQHDHDDQVDCLPVCDKLIALLWKASVIVQPAFKSCSQAGAVQQVMQLYFLKVSSSIHQLLTQSLFDQGTERLKSKLSTEQKLKVLCWMANCKIDMNSMGFQNSSNSSLMNSVEQVLLRDYEASVYELMKQWVNRISATDQHSKLHIGNKNFMIDESEASTVTDSSSDEDNEEEEQRRFSNKTDSNDTGVGDKLIHTDAPIDLFTCVNEHITISTSLLLNNKTAMSVALVACLNAIELFRAAQQERLDNTLAHLTSAAAAAASTEVVESTDIEEQEDFSVERVISIINNCNRCSDLCRRLKTNLAQHDLPDVHELLDGYVGTFFQVATSGLDVVVAIVFQDVHASGVIDSVLDDTWRSKEQYSSCSSKMHQILVTFDDYLDDFKSWVCEEVYFNQLPSKCLEHFLTAYYIPSAALHAVDAEPVANITTISFLQCVDYDVDLMLTWCNKYIVKFPKQLLTLDASKELLVNKLQNEYCRAKARHLEVDQDGKSRLFDGSSGSQLSLRKKSFASNVSSRNSDKNIGSASEAKTPR